jgi:hypothetical protein
MSLHHTIACDPPTSRRWRRYAPLLLAAGLTALALAPGVISGDGPHQISACGAQGGEGACPGQPSALLAEPGAVR